MKILVYGSGAREHALCWKLAKSKRDPELFCWPSNALINTIAQPFPVSVDASPSQLIEAIKAHQIDLVVVGPEQPLEAGFIDLCQHHGILAFGPNRRSAKLEASKAYAKKILAAAGIATAPFVIVTNQEQCESEALAILERQGGVVLKASGLAAGKGVFVCFNREDLREGIARLFSPSMREASAEVVLEHVTVGRECSFFVLCGPGGTVELDFAVDHKRLLDNDRGPNTGGMGAYAPAGWLPSNAREEVMTQIVNPLLDTLKARGEPYLGWLYVGLMWTKTGPSVIEFNVRLGDPEAQILAVHDPRDWLTLILMTLGLEPMRLDGISAASKACTVGVVMASQGYPYGDNEGGFTTLNLGELTEIPDTLCFGAAVKAKDSSHLTTATGRVMTVVATASDWTTARKIAYRGVSRIKQMAPSLQFRTDIAGSAES